jgi:hypothetical protein
MPRAALHHPARVTTGGDYPVTTTRAPTVRCDLCQRNQAVTGGRTASQVLTSHYERRHAASRPVTS